MTSRENTDAVVPKSPQEPSKDDRNDSNLSVEMISRNNSLNHDGTKSLNSSPNCKEFRIRSATPRQLQLFKGENLCRLEMKDKEIQLARYQLEIEKLKNERKLHQLEANLNHKDASVQTGINGADCNADDDSKETKWKREVEILRLQNEEKNRKRDHETFMKKLAHEHNLAMKNKVPEIHGCRLQIEKYKSERHSRQMEENDKMRKHKEKLTHMKMKEMKDYEEAERKGGEETERQRIFQKKEREDSERSLLNASLVATAVLSVCGFIISSADGIGITATGGMTGAAFAVVPVALVVAILNAIAWTRSKALRK